MGTFTVPAGGGGTYYFSVIFAIRDRNEGAFQIQLNNEAICTAYEDATMSVEHLTSGEVTSVAEGTSYQLDQLGLNWINGCIHHVTLNLLSACGGMFLHHDGSFAAKWILANIGKQVWMECECESLNELLLIDINWFRMMTGLLPAWIQNRQSNIILLRFKIYSLKLQLSHVFSDYCY